jgi:hypothetical protein
LQKHVKFFWVLLVNMNYTISTLNGSYACVLSIKMYTLHKKPSMDWMKWGYLSQTLTTSDWCVITATSRRIGLMRGYTNCSSNGMSTVLVHNESDWPHHCILSLSLLQEFACLSEAGYTHATMCSAMKMIRKFTTPKIFYNIPANQPSP